MLEIKEKTKFDGFCHTCKKPCKDLDELAIHILSQPRETHPRGRCWAAAYNQRHLLNKREYKGNFAPPTDDQLETKKNCQRLLSGETRTVKIICLKGKHPSFRTLEEEYINDPDAYRVHHILAVTCRQCGGS
jgi:hypothetical protein